MDMSSSGPQMLLWGIGQISREAVHRPTNTGLISQCLYVCLSLIRPSWLSHTQCELIVSHTSVPSVGALNTNFPFNPEFWSHCNIM